MRAIAFLVLVGFLTVEGVRIHLPKIPNSEFIPNFIPNDPRCVKDGLFANPSDCSSYYACKDGAAQDRKCPEGMNFHPLKHCTFDEVECDKQNAHSVEEEFVCPDDYGMYPNVTDCHNYIVCLENEPLNFRCPDEQIYQDHVGCVEGDVCPQTQNSVSADTGDCLSPEEKGPCKAHIMRYYYDVYAEECKSFVYGGCEGNANNYESKTDCERTCLQKPSQSAAQDGERCLAPHKVGPCRARITKYYYDINTGQCKAFTYGGCEGNANKYDTKLECELTCHPREWGSSGICQSPNQVVADQLNCRRYTQCVNHVPQVVTCSRGEGFSDERQRCVPLAESDCKSNNVLHILEH